MKLDRSLRFEEVLALPGVVEESNLASAFGFMAFHAGNLERRTEFVAVEAATRAGASHYVVVQPEGTRQHFPSAGVRGEASERLAEFLDHCTHVVAVHGYGREGHWRDLLFGGRNRALAEHLGQHVRAALPSRYSVVTDLAEIPAGLRGQHRENPVNVVSGGGVQLELPPGVRGLTPSAAGAPYPFPDLVTLSESLAAGALSWG